MMKPVRTSTAMTPTRDASKPAYDASSGYLLVAPADLETIYNFNPVYKSGVTGKGETVVVIENTNLYSTEDYTTFRKTFGLDSYKSGSFSAVHPGGCPDPGVVADTDFEATIDAEWAAAAAPDANIVLASCADTTDNFGVFIALQGLVDSHTPPTIVSISYGICEAELGAALNRYINVLYQQASAGGMSVYVAAGDEGAASCDAGGTAAINGIAVSGFASTPYNLAAGGTDFSDSYSGTDSQYWSTTNTATFGSAKSYIPEMPWDDSCANGPLFTYEGYSTPYGDLGFCNSAFGEAYFLDVVGGSGGPSGCAYGETSPDIGTPAVSGTCRGYAKPIWQWFLAGVPNDGVRDIPDVSLFAANGVWGHYYVVCYSDLVNGGRPCVGAPGTWAGAGGTSFVSPILAGVQALLNQKTRSRQGNPDYAYYALATLEYGFKGNDACDSNNGSNACIVTLVPFLVEYDEVTERYFCDVAFDPDAFGGAYKPFVQLEIAAYQPNALSGLQLSSTITVPFTQIFPDRTLTVTLSPGQGAGDGPVVGAVLRGTGPATADPQSYTSDTGRGLATQVDIHLWFTGIVNNALPFLCLPIPLPASPARRRTIRPQARRSLPV